MTEHAVVIGGGGPTELMPVCATRDRTGLHADAEPALIVEADLPSPIGHGGEQVQ